MSVITDIFNFMLLFIIIIIIASNTTITIHAAILIILLIGIRKYTNFQVNFIYTITIINIYMWVILLTLTI